MRLIHLSDIHFTSGDTWDPDVDQRHELWLDVGALVDAGGAVDGILIGGDIAFSGADEEYAVAADWIEKIRSRSGCPPGHIWVVPGNHDIDRPTHKKNRARKKMIEELRDTPLDLVDARLGEWMNVGNGILGCLDAYNRFSQEWVAPTTAAEPHWTDLTLDLDGLDVCLTGINSVIASDSSDRPYPSVVLGTQQCCLQRRPNRVHIAVAHHPPSWILDWKNVESYLRRAHLVLFGHEHRFWVEQKAPGLTVTVYAGAVGPERPGADPTPAAEDEEAEGTYTPSWNLITIVRDSEDVLKVSVQPRVWDAEETRFVAHPEGDQTRLVRLDLTPITGAGDGGADANEETPTDPIVGPGSGETEHAGSNSSPLIPGSAEVQSGVPLPSPAERSALRRLAVAFMSETPTRRVQIAEQLGVAEGLAEMDLTSAEEGREILVRIRAANKIDDLRERIDA